LVREAMQEAQRQRMFAVMREDARMKHPFSVTDADIDAHITDPQAHDYNVTLPCPVCKADVDIEVHSEYGMAEYNNGDDITCDECGTLLLFHEHILKETA
jgi:hypothetical protein